MSKADRPLLICGTRSFAEEIADVVSDTPGFAVAGFVENLDLELAQASVMLIPHLEGSGVRIKLLQALAAGDRGVPLGRTHPPTRKQPAMWSSTTPVACMNA